jgi:hypothetical protein
MLSLKRYGCLCLLGLEIAYCHVRVDYRRIHGLDAQLQPHSKKVNMDHETVRM